MAVNLMRKWEARHEPAICTISQNLTERGLVRGLPVCMLVWSRFETPFAYSVNCIYRNEYRTRFGSPFPGIRHHNRQHLAHSVLVVRLSLWANTNGTYYWGRLF
jgi:hypothetical protein